MPTSITLLSCQGYIAAYCIVLSWLVDGRAYPKFYISRIEIHNCVRVRVEHPFLSTSKIQVLHFNNLAALSRPERTLLTNAILTSRADETNCVNGS